MRLFVALTISDEVRRNLDSLLGMLRPVDAAPRWVNTQNLHTTLKFIGEVSPANAAAVSDALATVRIDRPLWLQFRGVGFFPDARRPSVAWVGIESNGHLAELAARIDQALALLEIPREERDFTPHLTIARFKERKVSPALAAEIEAQKVRSLGTMHCNEFHLIESKLKSGGAEYTTLRSFALPDRAPKGNG